MNNHDVMYKNFLAKLLGPATVALHCYMVAFLGVVSVVVIMMNCLSLSKYKSLMQDKVKLNIAAIELKKNEPVVSALSGGNVLLSEAIIGGAKSILT